MIIHTFNTGRLYTQFGQRIAWTILSTGNIGMVDIDRNIEYVLANPNFDDSSTVHAMSAYVLCAYDRVLQPKFDINEWKELQNAVPALRRAAATMAERVQA